MKLFLSIRINSLSRRVIASESDGKGRRNIGVRMLADISRIDVLIFSATRGQEVLAGGAHLLSAHQLKLDRGGVRVSAQVR